MIILSFFYRRVNNIIAVVTLMILLSISLPGQSVAIQQSNISINRFDKTYSLPDAPELSDYIKFGLTSNPGIQAVYNRYKAEFEEISSATRLPDPALSFGYFLKSIETAVGPQEYKLGIMQPIPFFGKLALQGNIQKIRAQQAYQQLVQKLNSLRYQIKAAYYDYFYIISSINITRDQIQLIKQWEGQIATKFKTGQSSYPDLLKAQIELLKLENKLKTLLDRKGTLLANFQALLNAAEISELNIPSDLDTESLDKTNNYWAQLEAHNPELQSSLYQIELQKKSLNLSKLQYYPDFGIGLDYIFTGDKYNSTGSKVSESGKDPLVLKFSLSLPIWWGKTRAKVKSFQFQRQEAIDKKLELENQLSAQITEVLNQIKDDYRQIELYQEQLIPKSEQLLEVTETAYMNGKSDFLSLIDAQRSQLKLILTLKKVRVEYLKSRAALEKLIGRTL